MIDQKTFGEPLMRECPIYLWSLNCHSLLKIVGLMPGGIMIFSRAYLLIIIFFIQLIVQSPQSYISIINYFCLHNIKKILIFQGFGLAGMSKDG